MAVTLTNPLQNLGAGDQRALAIEQFAGLVLVNFPMLSMVWPNIAKRTINEGNSVQFPAIGNMGTIRHTPGEQLPGGGEPLSEERNVVVDDKEIVSHSWVSRVQEFMEHFDSIMLYAMQAAQAIADTLDHRALRTIVLGARQPARANGTFKSGCRMQKTTDGVQNAYAATNAGSLVFETDLSELGQMMDERNVPRAMRIAYVSPYLMRVASLNPNAVSRDFTDLNPNSRVKMRTYEFAGFTLVPSNQIDKVTGLGNVVDDDPNYVGNFTKTAVVATGHSQAAGAVMFGGIDPFGPEYYAERRASLLGAAWFGGMKWLRPEACGELYCSATAFP